MLIATLSRLGMNDETEWAAEQLDIIAPDFTLDDIARMFPIKDKDKLQNIINNLRLAGIK